MKRFLQVVLFALAVAALAAPLVSNAGSQTGNGKAPVKATYLVLAPHTEAECLQALDDEARMGGLAKWQFGCMDGDHTGYLITTATDASAALAMVPASVRGKARAVKLHTFTAMELKQAHEHMGASK
jgi:hypothetical protein